MLPTRIQFSSQVVASDLQLSCWKFWMKVTSVRSDASHFYGYRWRARTCKLSFRKNAIVNPIQRASSTVISDYTVERIMSILNIGFQNIALERKESPSKNVIKNCKNIEDWRKNQGIKHDWQDSVKLLIETLVQRRLQLRNLRSVETHH